MSSMPGVKILQRRRLGVQRAVQAVENRQQSLHRIGERVVPELLLLFLVALAKFSNSAWMRAARSR